MICLRIIHFYQKFLGWKLDDHQVYQEAQKKKRAHNSNSIQNSKELDIKVVLTGLNLSSKPNDPHHDSKTPDTYQEKPSFH